MPHNFWMINCNEPNFDITRELGFTSQGLKGEYRRKVQRVEPDDRVIYYVTGIRVFTATATVTRGYEETDSSPWITEGKTPWLYQIGIKPDVVLDNSQYIKAGMLAYRLEYIRQWPPEDWHLAFQGNLHLLSKSDFFLLECEMRKIRDGREKALAWIDVELAAEAERANSQRDRRRRNSNRPAQPSPRERTISQPQPGNRPTPESLPSPEPDAPPDASPAPRTRSPRLRRAQTARTGSRNRGRRTPPPANNDNQ